MKRSIDGLERDVIKFALRQFNAHLKANNLSTENWLANLKSEGRSKNTMALIRAVAKLDKAIKDAK